MTYTAPVDDLRFVLEQLVGYDRLAALPGHADVSDELVGAVLEEAAKFAGGVLAPLNVVGDRQGSRFENGVVRTPDGWRDAYRRFVAGGWNAVPFPAAYGGQGLPWTVQAALAEMWQSANLSFGLCPMLNQGAVDALLEHGSEAQKRIYLPKLIEGSWTGTMNLTEPQAGSDLGAVRTRAERNGDGTYRLFGQKIFITYGEHDLSDNIVHMVLARTPDAPQGVKGISLFIAPKFRVNDDGSLGARNDLRCVSLEHKLGIHGSPTAVMAYGDNEGAAAALVGEEGRGLEYMFTMMNNARLSVGLQGVAIAERAYQQARDYALQRVQGRGLDGSKGPVAIIEHPDVRRMLVKMRALTEASRALALRAFAAYDGAHAAGDASLQAEVDLLTPIVKAWSTDIGVEVASLGVQVHGGMGFIEETGAAQYYRDARILPIYEGTNGIQAGDLAFRKLVRDDGRAFGAWLASARHEIAALGDLPGDDLAVIRTQTGQGLELLQRAADWMVTTGKRDPWAVAAGAVPFLRMAGLVAGGVEMARAAAAAARGLAGGASGFLQRKLLTARFYAEYLLPQAEGLYGPMVSAHTTLRALETDAV
jgi:3-(methylthio)propanoyl-CoA dehydrogenase